MARPKTKNVDVMGDEIVETTSTETEPKVVQIVSAKEIPADTVQELTLEVVKPKVSEPDKTKMSTPICDIQELSEDDKQILIEKRIKSIISQTQSPHIPALIKYKEPGTTAVPPMYALVDFDHRFVNEGWDFYRTNVRNPYVKDYLQLIAKVMGKPNKIYTRLVVFNYE